MQKNTHEPMDIINVYTWEVYNWTQKQFQWYGYVKLLT